MFDELMGGGGGMDLVVSKNMDRIDKQLKENKIMNKRILISQLLQTN